MDQKLQLFPQIFLSAIAIAIFISYSYLWSRLHNIVSWPIAHLNSPSKLLFVFRKPQFVIAIAIYHIQLPLATIVCLRHFPFSIHEANCLYPHSGSHIFWSSYWIYFKNSGKVPRTALFQSQIVAFLALMWF